MWKWLKKLISKPKTMWVWHLEEKDTDRLVSFCSANGITTLYLDHSIKNGLDKLKNAGLKISCLIGDSRNKLLPDEIIATAEKAWESELYDGLHLDIELAPEENMGEFNNKLIKVILGARNKTNFQLEIDIEVWRKDREYKEIISYADLFALMSYAPNAGKTAALTKGCRHRPFYVGIETNPDFKFSVKSKAGLDRLIDLINLRFFFNRNYRGTALHCWGFVDKLK